MRKSIAVLLCLMFIGQNVFADWDVWCHDCNRDLNTVINQRDNCIDINKGWVKLYNAQVKEIAELKRKQELLTNCLIGLGSVVILAACGLAVWIYNLQSNNIRLNADNIRLNANNILLRADFDRLNTEIHKRDIIINDLQGRVNDMNNNLNNFFDNVQQHIQHIQYI